MRTDLAKEAFSRFPDLQGVTEEAEAFSGLAISRIRVQTQEAAKKLDKPMGSYITLTMEKEALQDKRCREAASKRIAHELKTLIEGLGSALAVGLGNRRITPDALGPRTMEGLLVTRHVKKHCPELINESVRTVSAFSAGVLGVTGIETAEAVSGMTRAVEPDFLIAVDALAAMESDHLGCMVQLNDTGISPGAGVGNFRASLNKETLGIPVIAIGMPLVLTAEAILEDGLRRLDMREPPRKNLEESFLSMVVTPKDIDAMVEDAASMLSLGLNLGLYGEDYPSLEGLGR